MSQSTRKKEKEGRERERENSRMKRGSATVRAQVNTQPRSFCSGWGEEGEERRGEERRLRGDRVLSERREADESERARALIKKVAH